MSKNKKIDIKNSKQVNGKINDLNKKEPRTLDELFGQTFDKYEAKSLEDYENWLNSVNSADIREHAVKIGFMPHPDVNRLKKKLVAEYQKYAAAFQERPVINNNLRQPDKAVLKIMSEVK